MNKLWIDLEISGDIDDAVMLIFALEHNLNVKAVSLLNPSNQELDFVRYWLDYFNQDIALFVHNDNYVKNSNTTHKIINRYKNTDYPVFKLENITDTKGYTVIGGGAYTIPLILAEKGFDYFILQGGFAGAKVCNAPVLEKFRNKNECSSWNPNLDLMATKSILSKRMLHIDFISKDICHDSDIDLNFVHSMKNGATKDFLTEYFGNSSKQKKMHDIVALSYFVDNSFITMVPVEMNEKNGKWSSEFSEFSRKNISIQWEKTKFLEILKK